ncbi:MAG: response regulator [Sediminispirochaetaceae bacterium]
MKRVLIVDDEKTIRNGISLLVSQTGRYEIVGTCSNGKEAYEVTAALKPDIVITDIRMPEMDGLSYISECSKLPEVPKYIILSGFQEFDYLREAHLLDVVDYILKPVNHRDLIDLLDKVSEKIEAEKRERQLQLSQYGILSIQQHEKNPSHLLQLKERLGIDMENIRVFIISVKNAFTIDPSRFREVSDVLRKELYGLEDGPYISFQYEKQLVLIFSGCHPDPSVILGKVGSIAAGIERRFSLPVKVGAGGRFGGDTGIRTSYEQAMTALIGSFYDQDRQVHRCDPQWLIADDPETYYKKTVSELSYYLELCDQENGLISVDNFFEDIRRLKPSPHVVISFGQTVYRVLKDCFRDYRIVLSYDVLQEEKLKRYLLENHPSLDDVRQLINASLIEAYGYLREMRSSKIGHVTGEIINYINTHLAEDLYLDRICEIFSINKSYLCRIFKETTGKTFNTYLTELRINRSKLLLKHENLRINEIAALVGYSNPRYYARTFQKLERMTPTDYRNTLFR